MSKSETTSEQNWKVIRDGEAGSRGSCWHKVTFTLDDFLTLEGLMPNMVKVFPYKYKL